MKVDHFIRLPAATQLASHSKIIKLFKASNAPLWKASRIISKKNIVSCENKIQPHKRHHKQTNILIYGGYIVLGWRTFNPKSKKSTSYNCKIHYYWSYGELFTLCMMLWCAANKKVCIVNRNKDFLLLTLNKSH